MLEVCCSKKSSRRWSIKYSGLCDVCGEVFYTPLITSRDCSIKCTRSRTGSDAPCWKGGRYVGKGGYLFVHKPTHPSSNYNGYIQEHRFVMEQILKRPLKSFENVHHKNGIRSDNRPSNLELWTKPQTIGQRPEDLIQFVIDNYLEQVQKTLRRRLS